MRRPIMLAAAVLAAAACTDAEPPTAADATADLAAASASPKAADAQSFEVTIRNLTSGQPLTPPVAAIHSRAADVFTVGRPASFEVAQVAENGAVGQLAMALEENRHVSDVMVVPDGSPPPILPGDDVTFEIDAAPGARFLSFVSMLICTNDGFTGLDAVRLPRRVGEEASWTSDGYDAGSEINTEDFADLVPPCQGLVGVTSSDPGTDQSEPALAENGVIRHHPGIQGGEDLVPSVHGWSDPVAMITVRRLD